MDQSGKTSQSRADKTILRNAAVKYAQSGLRVVPIPFKEKGPQMEGWQKLEVQPHQVEPHFRNGGNLGVICGIETPESPFINLSVIDLDVPEFLEVADEHLTETGAVIGRPGSPGSHWLYSVDDRQQHKKAAGKVTGSFSLPDILSSIADANIDHLPKRWRQWGEVYKRAAELLAGEPLEQSLFAPLREELEKEFPDRLHRVPGFTNSDRQVELTGPIRITCLEILGHGQQCVVGPSVHPSGEVYDNLDPGSIATVSWNQVVEPAKELFDAAAPLIIERLQAIGFTDLATVWRDGNIESDKERGYRNRDFSPQPNRGEAPKANWAKGCRPGDEWNKKGDIVAYLLEHRYQVHSVSGERTFITRPGKSPKDGQSGNWHEGERKYYNFSDSDPSLEPDKAYDGVGLVKEIECNGDIAWVPQVLYAKGFGKIDPHGSACQHTLSATGKGVSNTVNCSGQDGYKSNAQQEVIAEPDPSLTYKQASPSNQEAWDQPIPLKDPEEVAPVSFPYEVFGPDLEAFTSEIGQVFGDGPREWGATAILVVAAAAIGNSRKIKIKNHYMDGLNLWAACVGPTGTAKTPLLTLITAPLDSIQDEYESEYNHNINVYNKKLAESREAGANKVIDMPPPIFKRTMVDDITREKLAEVLGENRRGILYQKDELSGMAESMNQYKAGGGDDRIFWLSLWSRKKITVDRKNQPRPIIIKSPYLSLIGGIQPKVIRKFQGLKSTDTEDGFLDRFLFCYPGKIFAKEEDWLTISDESIECWDKTVRYLNSLQPLTTGPLINLGDDYLVLSKESEEAYELYNHPHITELNSFPEEHPLRGPWAKLSSYLVRFTGLVHVLRCATGQIKEDETVIDPDTVHYAGHLLKYYKYQVKRIHKVMESPQALADAKHLLNWIMTPLPGGGKRLQFTYGRAFTENRSALRNNPDRRTKALELLEVYGIVRRTGRPEIKPSNRPAIIYEVNPYLWSAFKSDK